MVHQVKPIQISIIKSNEWISDLKDSYDYSDDEKAFYLLKATLKALRDRISPEEAFHLGNTLPHLIRGFYFEGWDPFKDTSEEKSPENFLTSVRRHLADHEDIDLEMAVPEALKVIFNKIDQQEAEQVKHVLPKDIQEYFS